MIPVLLDEVPAPVARCQDDNALRPALHEPLAVLFVAQFAAGRSADVVSHDAAQRYDVPSPCGLLPMPSAGLLAAAAALLEIERVRWAQLFEQAPVRPEREIAWQFFPIIPEDPPVL